MGCQFMSPSAKGRPAVLQTANREFNSPWRYQFMGTLRQYTKLRKLSEMRSKRIEGPVRLRDVPANFVLSASALLSVFSKGQGAYSLVNTNHFE